jgi:hypothetical protein
MISVDFNVIYLVVGIFIGYALSRKQADKPITDMQFTKDTPVAESIIDDPYTKAMLTDKQIEDIESRRAPTKMRRT